MRRTEALRWLVIGCSLGAAMIGEATLAAPIGMRPLGGEGEAARTVGAGGWLFEAGGWQPTLDPGDPANAEDQAVQSRYWTLPVWPDLRLQHGLSDGNEVIGRVGHVVTAGYRKHFLRADAPWGGEYLQGLLQGSVGFNLLSRRPVVHLSMPGIYEAGPFTLHVAGGGYYLFNDQPIVEGTAGTELRPFSWLSVGATARLRMDAKKVTPTDGVWSFGGGLRIQPWDHLALQVEAGKDAGPPEPTGGAAVRPRIEWPLQSLRASLCLAF